ncbi:hypothetical protein B1L02_21710 [Pseudoalteromonas piscicida]|uniref:ShKT domain-containing protein n=1 Tax=Pseudoalteromonas piscicida TaxID=43662 RepID=A0AAD0W600_PSEO7|nr:hypothetical protein B1L02_21710 [Pseudoalteromonas piscicida]AXR04147.1 hypothetical protein D0511_19580 [Pseudoalteromonas piscicida]
MKVISTLIILVFSACALATQTTNEPSIQTQVELDNLLINNQQPIHLNLVSSTSRTPPSCDWSECVDNCDESRKDCLKGSNSSKCGPIYERCKERCNKRCK